MSIHLQRILARLAVYGSCNAHPNQIRALHKRGMLARRDGSCPCLLARKHITFRGWDYITEAGLIRLARVAI